MSKSKHSNTNASVLLCGMSRCKDYKVSQAGAGVAQKGGGASREDAHRLLEEK